MTKLEIAIEYVGGPADGTTQNIPANWEVIEWTQPPPDPKAPAATETFHVYTRTTGMTEANAIIFTYEGINS